MASTTKAQGSDSNGRLRVLNFFDKILTKNNKMT